MLRKCVLFGAAALVLTLHACDSNNQTAATAQTPAPAAAQAPVVKAQKIAVVDTEAVFRDSKLATDGFTFLDRISTGMQARLAQMQKDMGAAPNDKELEAKLQSELMDMQMEQDVRQRTVAELVNKEFNSAVSAQREAQGIDLVLPRQLVLSGGENVDITKDVISKMDTLRLDFDELTKQALEKAKADNAKLNNPETSQDPAKQTAPATDAAKQPEQPAQGTAPAAGNTQPDQKAPAAQ